MNRAYFVLLPVALLAGCFSQPPAPLSDSEPNVVQSRTPSAPTVVGPGYYMVKKGDTLYRIALEHGQDYREVAAWNTLTNPSSIKEGQVIRVLPPGSEQGGAAVAKPIASAAQVETRPLDRPASATGNTETYKRGPKVGKDPYSDEAYARARGEPVAKASEPKPEAAPESKPEAKPEAVVGADDVNWAWPGNGKLLSGFNDTTNKGLDLAGKAGDPVLAAGEGKVVYAGSGLRGYGQLVILKHNATFLSAYAHNQKILVKEGQQVMRGQKIAEMGNSDSDAVKLHFEIRRQGKPVDPSAYLPKR